MQLCHVRRLTADENREDMAHSVKEEELGFHGGLDEHNDTGRDHCQEADDVHDTNAIKNDVSWPCQRFWREGHFCGRLPGSFVEVLGFGFDGFDVVCFDRNVQ
jgi:hypothetical protein